MKIHGNKIISDIVCDGVLIPICEFNAALTKRDIKRYQLQLIYAQEILDQVQKTVDEPHIAQVYENLKTLHKIYDRYIVDFYNKVKWIHDDK